MRKFKRKSLTVCALLTLLTLTNTGFGGTDVPVDGDPNVQNEISLTLIPGQPNNLVMAYNDNPSVGSAWSNDGGANWNKTQLPFGSLLPSWARGFDPTITADANGNVYVAFIVDGANPNPITDSAIYVSKSTDSGQTWNTPVQVAYDPNSSQSPPPPTDPNYRYNDRCQITADIVSSGSYRGNIYLAWIKDRGWRDNDGVNRPLGDIYFSRSTDSNTFSTPIIINDQVNNDMGNMPVPVVARDGTVYVSWMDYNVWWGAQGKIFIRKSTDGGLTFPAWGPGDHLITTIDLPGWENAPLFNVTGATADGSTKAKGAPVLAASATDANELYMVYAADPNVSDLGNEADIFFIKSTDAGQNWSQPLRVNDDGTKNDQIMPWIDVKPDDTIDIAWYDRRNDTNDVYWDVYIARSVDSGVSFSTNVRLNDSSFLAPANWLGEYLGLAVDANNAYVAFTSDTLNGDVYFDKIKNSDIPIRGDFEPDGDVDLVDFSALASAWKTTPANLIKWNPVCDISNPKDNTIDLKDVDIFTDNWLYKE